MKEDKEVKKKVDVVGSCDSQEGIQETYCLVSLVIWWYDLLVTAARWWGRQRYWNEAANVFLALAHLSSMTGPSTTDKDTESTVHSHERRMMRMSNIGLIMLKSAKILGPKTTSIMRHESKVDQCGR